MTSASTYRAGPQAQQPAAAQNTAGAAAFVGTGRAPNRLQRAACSSMDCALACPHLGSPQQAVVASPVAGLAEQCAAPVAMLRQQQLQACTSSGDAAHSRAETGSAAAPQMH